jgi:hypothetical protein
MPEEDIRRLKATRKIQTRFTLKARSMALSPPLICAAG